MPILDNSEFIDARFDMPGWNNSEFVDEANGFNVIKELSKFDVMEFQVSSSSEDELDSKYGLVMARFKDTMKSCFINMSYRFKKLYVHTVWSYIFHYNMSKFNI